MTGGDRYSRQRRLAEIGDAGQERIERSQAEVRGNDGALAEMAYLLRAGVPAMTLRPGAPVEPFAHAPTFRFDASRRLAAGAWRALAHLRRTAEIGTP